MIDVLEEAALLAGREILRLQGLGLEFSIKSDGSERSNADLASEKVISQILQRYSPEITIIAEEAMENDPPIVLGKRFFLIDPLDGTREIKTGNSEYAVNIALVENGIPVLGVMLAPAERQLYSTRNGKAFRAEISRAGVIEIREEIRCRPFDSKNATGLVSRSPDRSHQSEDFLRAHGFSKIIKVGSTLKFCRLAEGRADVYASLGDTMEWDTAAGDAILRCAGGEVVNLGDNLPLQYGKLNQTKPLANPSFIARSMML